MKDITIPQVSFPLEQEDINRTANLLDETLKQLADATTLLRKLKTLVQESCQGKSHGRGSSACQDCGYTPRDWDPK